jgi:hypothetical protein
MLNLFFQRRFLSACGAFLLLFLALHDGYSQAAKNGTAKPKSAPKNYTKHVLPILNKFCMDCHDAETSEGELNFEAYLKAHKAESVPDLWERVAQMVEMGEMPPREKKQPTQLERDTILAWIKQLGDKWDSGAFGKDPGRTTLRRLNKFEYHYTIRNLFGLPIRSSNHFRFPPDSSGEAGFDNNADALYLSPILMENYTKAASWIVLNIYRYAGSRQRYLFVRPDKNISPEKAASTVIKAWGLRIFRRPIKKDEHDRLLALFKEEIGTKKSYDEAMKRPLLSMLMSPSFLYRAEEKINNSSKPYRIDDFALASRMSYFIWSSTPDDRLLELAATGKLHQPGVVTIEVRRMLEDQKAYSLATRFAGVWLGWEKLRVMDPDPKKFPSFTRELRVALYHESSFFFQHLLKNNGSAYDLLHCNYSFLNETSARHYGISGVKGPEVRKVTLKDPRRGGILGMGSVLTTTSLPLRTSPSVRGNFILTQILGTPPPEPPADVSLLPDDDRAVRATTFRKSLEQHRTDRNCKSCHERVDPLGFGLENFDAIGRWRTHQNDKPVDANGVLPDGRKFSSPAGLKKILLEEKENFIHVMVDKLLSYALGRDLSPYDRQSIHAISRKVIADNGRINTAIFEVVRSYPFQYRKEDIPSRKALPAGKKPSKQGKKRPQTKRSK